MRTVTLAPPTYRCTRRRLLLSLPALWLAGCARGTQPIAEATVPASTVTPALPTVTARPAPTATVPPTATLPAPTATAAPTVTPPTPTPETGMTVTLFDFREEQARAAWFVENDVVMGGISSSSMQAGDGVLLFSGTVSLENNGGFASARAEFAPLDLSAYSGVAIRVRGDGKRYTLYLRDRPGFIGYQGRFDTLAGEWQMLRLPFNTLRPVRFGSPVQAGNLNTAAIRAIGLIISDKQAGSFTLELAAIGFY